jgi:dihydroneopterin aldolase
MSSYAVLKISELALSVHIGCTPEERAKSQEVRISFQIKPDRLPEACTSDKLEETICYETLIASIHRLVPSQAQFNTVEKLGYDCFQSLKKALPREARLFLSIHKVNPPIDSLKGGIYFELSDEGFHS